MRYNLLNDLIGKGENMVQETLNKIRSFMNSSKAQINELSGQNAFWVREGSAIVNIHVEKFREDSAIVSIFSNVVRGAKLDAKLLQYLLELNAKLNFGAFALHNNIIIFKYDIVGGKHMDFEEFKNALIIVALISDEYDNKIIDVFGGKTAIDVLEENWHD